MEGLGMNNVDLPGGSCGLSGLPAEENAFGHIPTSCPSRNANSTMFTTTG
jgi:hypothetical protein